MKVDASGVPLERLVAHLQATHGVDVAEIAFVPKGEDGHAYGVVARDGRRLWARLQLGRHRVATTRALSALLAMRARCSLGWAVAPIPTRRGRATSRLDGRVVALFPFIEGASAHERPISDEQVAETARALAALHGCPPPNGLAPVPLRDPHGRAIRRLLSLPASVGERAARSGGSERPGDRWAVRSLLAAHRDDLLAALRLADGLGARLAARAAPRVALHGDPNWANVLAGEDGRVHLVDWGGLALGPREWDLAHLSGDRFELVLSAYLAAAGPVVLHEDAFRYHGYRWALQEVADYAGRLLLGHGDPTEDAHAWEELRAHLPIRHGAILAEAERAGAVVRAVGGALASGAAMSVPRGGRR